MEVSPPAPHEISRLQLLASPLAKLRHLDLSHRISGATLGPISRSGAFSDVYKVRLRNPEETVVAKHLRFQLGTYMEGVSFAFCHSMPKKAYPNFFGARLKTWTMTTPLGASHARSLLYKSLFPFFLIHFIQYPPLFLFHRRRSQVS